MRDALAGIAARSFARLVACRRLLVVATVAAVALLVVLVSGVRLDGRVETFLPAEDRHLAAYTEALGRFGTAETVFIDISAAASPDAARGADASIHTAAAIVESRLRASGLFREFVGRPSDAERSRTAEVILSSAPLLLDDAALARIDERLQPDELADRMEEHVSRLIGAAGAMHEQAFRRDPLGIAGIALGPAASGGIPAGARIEEQRVVSGDGRHVLLVAVAASPAGDEVAGRAIAAEIAAAGAACPPGVRVSWIGGHRFFLANSTTLRADIERISLAGIALVLVIVAAAFRSVRVVTLAALTIGVGGLCAVAAGAAWFPSISGISLAVGASLAGVTVDYVLHLHAVPRRGERPGGAAARVYAELLPTITIGAATSVVAYLVLLASPVPGHRQVGVVAAAGVAGAFLFSATTAAVAGAWRRDDAPVAQDARPTPIERFSVRLATTVFARRGAAAIVAAILCVAAIATLPAVRFETDMRRFESKDAATLAAEADFAATWGDAFSNSIVRIRAADTESALRATERVTDALAPMVGSGIRSLTSVVPVVPSAERQRARWDAWRRHWDAGRIDAARAALGAAAAEFGVRDDAFAPFLASLGTEPAPLVPGSYAGTAFEPVVRRHLSIRDGDVESIVVVGGASADGSANGSAGWVQAVTAADPDARILTRRGLAEAVVRSSRDQLVRLAVPGFVLMGLLMWAYYRCVARAVIGLAPLAASLATTAACLHVAGVSLSLMNVAASLPIAGLGVDYAIFLIDAIDGAAPVVSGETQAAAVGRVSAPAIAAALTTAAGGVAMLAASHPAIWSMGLALTVGIATSLAFTWLGVPWLMQRLAKGRR